MYPINACSGNWDMEKLNETTVSRLCDSLSFSMCTSCALISFICIHDVFDLHTHYTHNTWTNVIMHVKCVHACIYEYGYVWQSLQFKFSLWLSQSLFLSPPLGFLAPYNPIRQGILPSGWSTDSLFINIHPKHTCSVCTGFFIVDLDRQASYDCKAG